MSINKYTMALLSLLMIISIPASSQGFLSTNGKAIVNENGDTIILKGMGLGGWMLQEGYMLQTSGFANAQYQIRDKIEQLIGPEDTDLFYEAWLSNHVRRADIDSLKAWGFNSVRLPMHYNLFTLPIEDEPVTGQNTWLSKGFELTDSLISWCSQNQMYVILDLHATPGGQGKDEGIADYNPLKPSLWESQENRDKTVALWKKLAERYADESWVGGYDLINETNWEMTGNNQLRDLLEEISDSIRTVDSRHILFIEGNWFANDFTGLTPPWDNNMVYSPHKYWSINDQASIQWVLDIRNTHNVPIYFGECGENSNTWFRDAIRLFEEYDIGWAWWPMKKIESIAGPLSITKTAGYQTLLDYWNGTGSQPTAAFTKSTLMEIADKLKIEDCIYQKDVLDAMFRQVYSEEAVPYRTQDIPGIVYATDFDMGVAGSAYFDIDLANYHVTTGNYTAWNQGWAYRNDGVDIEATEDIVNTNGYNVGWLATGEWMQYDVNVAASAIYDIHVRVAANEPNGKFHICAGDADISGFQLVPGSGGWQNWQTIVVPGVILSPDDNKLKFHVDVAGFNLNSLEFIQKSATTTIPTDYLSATTLDEHTIQLTVNKPLADPNPESPASFQILVNGNAVPITSAVLNTSNSRIITFSVNHTFTSSDLIRISYSGDQINSKDGLSLKTFTQKDVQNTIAIIHPVPGRVEAEEYYFQSGIELENTTDAGGGQNIGYLDAGDYLDYYIHVTKSGIYTVQYRTASESQTGQIQLQLFDATGGSTVLQTLNFPSTGGWQTWATTSQNVSLPAGQHHIRVVITRPLFNINWFEFTFLSSAPEIERAIDLKLFPNPGNDIFILSGSVIEVQDIDIQIYNLTGQSVFLKTLHEARQVREALDLGILPDGQYLVVIRFENGMFYSDKILKISY